MKRLGIVGAGAMGAGIAELARSSGLEVVVYDPDPSLDTADSLAALADCDAVIEAVPEKLDLKVDVFTELCEHVADDCLLASNTSSIPITSIAARVPHPERVVGLHFFNPPPKMPLVEVIPADQTSDETVERARVLGEALGKTVIQAADIPGFLVNRINRPFYLESLKLLEEGVADHRTIDFALRRGGGFRMGPFELADFVGIDVNHAVSEFFHEASYGEPRYRPSPLAARKVAAGTLGRKTGRGWYEYPEVERHRPKDPDPPEAADPAGRGVTVLGDDALAVELGRLLQTWDGEPWLTLDLRSGSAPPADGPVARLVRDDFLHTLDPTAAGFHALMPLKPSVEVTRTAHTDPLAFERTTELFAGLGFHAVEVGDGPGLVTGRVVCQIINEAAFLLGAGDGTAEDVDAGLELGVAHPQGPVAWASAIGLPSVVATLDGLHRALGEERYRVAPLLRQLAAQGGDAVLAHRQLPRA